MTFDSGGYSLKPPARMHEMKFDMSGGAAVIEAIAALAELRAPVRVLGVIGATENLVNGRAVKPGDVVRSREGLTIEVDNTDAEGRLVLCDCLSWAREQGAERIVDIATLTGGVVSALGDVYAGLLGDDAMVAEVEAAAADAGELVWRLPLHPRYAKKMEGAYADLRNSAAERTKGQPSTAAAFLSRFTGGLPWAHLDVAGVTDGASLPYINGKGGTGFGLRTLVALAERVSAADRARSAPAAGGQTPAARHAEIAAGQRADGGAAARHAAEHRRHQERGEEWQRARDRRVRRLGHVLAHHDLLLPEGDRHGRIALGELQHDLAARTGGHRRPAGRAALDEDEDARGHAAREERAEGHARARRHNLDPMDFDLSDDHRLLRSTVREFAEERVAPVAEELDRTKAFPYEIVAEARQLNLMGIPFPEEYGGAGADTLAYAIAVEELTRIDCPWRSRSAPTPRSARSRSTCSAPRRRSRSGCRGCARARSSAPSASPSPRRARRRQHKNPCPPSNGDWVIDGAKQFITNAGTDISGVVCITAGPAGRERENEISNLIVPNGTPGYEQGEPYRKMGWNASDTRPLTFTRLPRPGGEPARPARRGLPASSCTSSTSAGSASPRWAWAWPRARWTRRSRYAKERRAFGKPISKFQAIQGSSPTCRPRSRRPACWSTRRRARRTPERNFSLTAAQAKLKTGRLAVRAPRRPSRSTAGTATSRSTRCAACTATRRSSRSARAPTRCSRW